MDFKMFREFHWLTKIVIGLTGLFFGLMLVAIVVTLIWPNDYQASNGIGMLLLSLGWVLTQAFLVILVIVLISFVVTGIKTWIEKYLDQVLAKLDTLATQKSEQEHAGETLAVLTEKTERIERKLDNIERILEKVSD